MENDSQIDQRWSVFTRSVVVVRHRDAECAMGGWYGMGNRRNGTSCGFGDSRCNLRHHEEVNRTISGKLGAKPTGYYPFETNSYYAIGDLIF
jgi:hypothetical protein